MTRCPKLVDLGRRRFLSTGAAATVGAAASACSPTAPSPNRRTGSVLAYPSNWLANIRNLTVDVPLEVSYPDETAPGVLLRFSRRVEGGVGPEGDIVGFTTVCPHQGYSLEFDSTDRTLNCPGHYSRFDLEAGGQQIWGQASQNLPQYLLRMDAQGDIFAEGIDELLYGRLSNIL